MLREREKVFSFGGMNAASGSEGQEAPKVERVNPWLGIWVRPRATLLYVWQHMLEDYIHRLYMLVGLTAMLALRLPDWLSTPPHPIGVMVQVLLFAPLGGLVAGYLFSALMRWMASKMQREVPSPHAKAMTAWTFLPFAAFWLVLWAAYYALDGHMAALHPHKIWAFKGMAGWLPLLVASPLYIWGVVARVRAIMVTFGLDAPRAVGLWLATAILTYVPAALLGYNFILIFYVASSSAS